MHKKFFFLLSAAAVLSAVSLTACSPKEEVNTTESVSDAEITLTSKPDFSEELTESSEMTTETPISLEKVGTFSTTDIYDNPVTDAIFAEHDLTMVNVFATWCGPCIREIPDLAELAKEYEGSNFQIIGLILDVNDTGIVNEEKREVAKELAEITKAEYPFIMPDSALRYGVLGNVYSIPETFFVDSDGFIVSERYLGSRSKNQWQEIIEKELSELK